MHFFLINNFLIYGSTEIPIPLVYLLKCGHFFHNGPKMLNKCFKKKTKKPEIQSSINKPERIIYNSQKIIQNIGYLSQHLEVDTFKLRVVYQSTWIQPTGRLSL